MSFSGKTNPHEEISRLNNELVSKNKEIEVLKKLLEKQAITDSATGLYKRWYFNLQAPQVIARAERNKTNICVAMCSVNDIGLVRDLAHCLLSEIRQGLDTAYTLGGDFVVVMEQSDENGGHALLDRVQSRFSKNSPGTTLAIGIASASWRAMGSSLDDLVQTATDKMHVR